MTLFIFSDLDFFLTFRSCFLSSFVELRSAVSEQKSKMSQPIRSQGGHLVFTIGPKNTNLVEDIEVLLPVKFRWILFIGFREEVKNVSANQRPGRPSCFSDRPKKHKLGRGRWDLASCQVSLNSVQQFQRKVENVKVYRRRTDDGRCAMTIAHLSLLLRWAKKEQIKLLKFTNWVFFWTFVAFKSTMHFHFLLIVLLTWCHYSEYL